MNNLKLKEDDSDINISGRVIKIKKLLNDRTGRVKTKKNLNEKTIVNSVINKNIEAEQL